MSATQPSGVGRPLAFAAKVMQLLEEGRQTSTYKFAVLVALMDVVRAEKGATGRTPETVPMADLAHRVAELYWLQTRPFSGTRPLLQNPRHQAEILTLIANFQHTHGLSHLSPFGQAERLPDHLQKLLGQLEVRLAQQPVALLQRIGGQTLPVIYTIDWDERVSPRQYQATDRTIRLVPGAADNLVAIAPVLREIVYARWVTLVADINRADLRLENLEEYLFGVDRTALGKLVTPLRELQSNRCFYCRKEFAGRVEVDHFLAWSRYADDGIENLVLADRNCNNSKREYPAAGEHVVRWVERMRDQTADLTDIADREAWTTHRPRTLAFARNQYLELPTPDVRLWLAPGSFTVAGNDLSVITAALGAA